MKERQMEMFVIYQCPSCYMPTELKKGACDTCSGRQPQREQPQPMLEGGWTSSLSSAIFIGGAILLGAVALWWTSR